MQFSTTKPLASVRLLEAASRYAAAARNLGPSNAATVLWKRLFPRDGEVTLRTRRFGSITYRPAGDFGVMTHLFTRQVWIDTAGDPVRHIFDIGANIGVETIRFRAMYPDARITAVEAEPGNHALLLHNTTGRPNVVSLNAALWNDERTLSIRRRSDSHESYSVSPDPTAETKIASTTMPALLDLAGIDELDILKIDIEGAERAVFDETCDAWLPRVRCIVMECPDNDAPGTTAQVFGAFRRVGAVVSTYIQGENLVFVRGDLNWKPRPVLNYF